jgi:hypothetical protein
VRHDEDENPDPGIAVHYVYFHRDATGRVFYVGMGKGKRAWSHTRHEIWHRYVTERLGGVYTVEIFRDGLTEVEAAELEWDLLAEIGHECINWVNPGRLFDYAAIETYHRMRDANRQFVADTRPLERTDPDTAIARYRVAMATMVEYENITRERGIVAELSGGERHGDVNILDRLTLCLLRSGRVDEAVHEATLYFQRFPAATQSHQGRIILARVNKARP